MLEGAADLGFAVFFSLLAAIGYRTPSGLLQNPTMMPFEKLTAWQCCHELFLQTYRVTSQFPKHELYGLTSQIRRAAFSAAANIAEGSAKQGPREFRRFLDTSLGSLAEVAYAIRAATDLGLLTAEESKRLNEMRMKAGRCTWGLYRRVRSLADRRNRPTFQHSNLLTRPDERS
jgi:four helix bundle protein